MARLRVLLGACLLAAPGIAYAHGTEIALSFIVPMLSQPAMFWVMDLWARATRRPRLGVALILACSIVAFIWASSTQQWSGVWNTLFESSPSLTLLTHAIVLSLSPGAVAWVFAVIFFGRKQGTPR